MLFNSVAYIFAFLPLTVSVFWLLMWFGRKQWALSALSLASLFFYGWWNPVYVPLLLGLVLANYAIGYYLATAQRWRRMSSWSPALRRYAAARGSCGDSRTREVSASTSSMVLSAPRAYPRSSSTSPQTW